MIAFGPVPSRRLGYSLGINHIPPKHCPYSCVYCQVGRTTHLETTRRKFFPLNQILEEVERKMTECSQTRRVIDYLTLVPDGEPTLDRQLGKIIEELKKFKLPIAVISNASLIDNEEVQEALLQADWVSVKVDTVIEANWRQINRPHHRLSLPSILTGILNFHRKYHGELVTETMLISGINDHEKAIFNLCTYLDELQPFRSYLSIPTRPPAESWVKPPDADSLIAIFQIISKNISFMDLLFETEESDFQSTGNLIEDILGITSVHPIREEALQKMVSCAGADWRLIEELADSGRIRRIQYQDEWIYIRR